MKKLIRLIILSFFTLAVLITASFAWFTNADFIEPNRKPLEGMDEIRKEAFTNIDRCLAHILHDSVQYLNTIGKECDDATMEAYEYYKKFYKYYKFVKQYDEA